MTARSTLSKRRHARSTQSASLGSTLMYSDRMRPSSDRMRPYSDRMRPYSDDLLKQQGILLSYFLI